MGGKALTAWPLQKNTFSCSFPRHKSIDKTGKFPFYRYFQNLIFYKYIFVRIIISRIVTSLFCGIKRKIIKFLQKKTW